MTSIDERSSRAASAAVPAAAAVPTVSVVIPVFNRRRQVLPTVQSVLAQTLAPLEVILVDDGSSDGICAADYAGIDPRIRLIHQGENRGGAAARNTGFDAACGDWVALLDSDDLWEADKLERQFAHLWAEDVEGDVVATANVLSRRSDGSTQLYNDRPPRAGVPLCEYFLIEGATFQTSTLLLPTALARSVRFDERLKRHQDWDFVLRLAERKVHFSYIHEPLVIYDAAEVPGRVSQSKGAALTLYWYAVAGRLLTARARYNYYLEYLFWDHVAQDRPGALKTLAGLTFSYPRGARRTAKRLKRLWLG